MDPGGAPTPRMEVCSMNRMIPFLVAAVALALGLATVSILVMRVPAPVRTKVVEAVGLRLRHPAEEGAAGSETETPPTVS